MKISRIWIQRFRSIHELDFFPGSYAVLIGENNAGKSNILRALALVLGDTWPSERSFTEDDFFNQDTSEPISIKVFFDEVIEEWRSNKKCEIAGFEVSCKAYKRKVGNKPAGTLKVDYRCIDAKGDPVTYPEEPLQKGVKPKGRWVEFRVSSDMRERAPFIYVDVMRSYNSQSPASRWSVLRRLMNDVNKEFLSDSKKVSVKLPDGSEAQLTRKEAFEKTVRQAYQYLQIPSFVEIESKLAENAREHMGLDEESDSIELRFQSHDPINAFKSLELFIKEKETETPATEVGAGLQSAIVLAIFRTYQDLRKQGAIFAIEEPEVFLHPQKARFFRDVLHGMSEGGNQVFLTTHSPIFVDVSEPESVVLVRRTRTQGTKATVPVMSDMAPTDRAALRLLTEFHTERNELFFAQGVMLVEGNTEKIAYPFIFKTAKVDINRAGISVVECGGKTKLPLFIRVAKTIGVPYIAVADRDLREIKSEWSETRKQNETDRNVKHTRWNKDLEDTADAGCLFFLDPDFEAVAGLRHDEDTKIDKVMEMFGGGATPTLDARLVAPVNKLLALLAEKTVIVSETPEAGET